MSNGKVTWSDDASPAVLKEAIEGRDYGTGGRLLDALCDDLDASGRTINADVAKEVLKLLRKNAWFQELRRVAEKFDEYAQNDTRVLLHLAQARIEMDEITKAVGVLLALKKRIDKKLTEADLDPEATEEAEYDLGEIMGLLGRCYKQYYVDAVPSDFEPRDNDLKKSLAYYGDAYERRLGDYHWHGVNLVALLNHKERIVTGRSNAISAEAKETAERILQAVERKKRRGGLWFWDYANVIQSSLALGDTPTAIEATKDFLEEADAFSVQSTRRQLIEIWMLTEHQPPGSVILPMMNARFAELGSGPTVVELDPSKASEYEKVFGQTKYKSLGWLSEAFERAKSVARIGPNKYDGNGTGFLFDGAWISEEWAGKPLLLTNAHVCSDDPLVQQQYPYPLSHKELTAAFLGAESAGTAEELSFDSLIWSSPPSELDATLLQLERVPEGCKPPPVATRNPPVTTKGDARLNILGHPKGLELRISLQDNRIVDVGDRFVYYKTPTDPGSSGSPVFNQKWQLVALHHASKTSIQANEGVRIDVIISAIKEFLGQAASGVS